MSNVNMDLGSIINNARFNAGEAKAKDPNFANKVSDHLETVGNAASKMFQMMATGSYRLFTGVMGAAWSLMKAIVWFIPEWVWSGWSYAVSELKRRIREAGISLLEGMVSFGQVGKSIICVFAAIVGKESSEWNEQIEIMTLTTPLAVAGLIVAKWMGYGPEAAAVYATCRVKGESITVAVAAADIVEEAMKP